MLTSSKCCLIAFMATVITSSNSLGQVLTIRVDANAGSLTTANPAPDGSDWGSTAFKLLQDALSVALGQASSYDEVHLWLADGDYHPDRTTASSSGSGDRQETFILFPKLFIYGGFSGNETLITQRDPDTYKANLTGEINSGDNDDNSYHVVTALSNTITANNCWVDGVTIREGYADSDTYMYQGAGLRCYNGASPRFNNVTFTLNEVFSDGFQNGMGGAVYVDEGDPVFTLCLFKGNFVYSRAFGGAVCLDGGSQAEFICCNFGENEAAWGGAVASIGQSFPLLLNCLIADNYANEVNDADAAGGGVCARRCVN